MAVDTKGNIYIADFYNNRVRRVGPDGVITTIAGTGQEGFSGDGGPATQARLNVPSDVAVDAQGNVYIADSNNHRIRRVGPNGVITTIAGTGPVGGGEGRFSGDGRPATQARLNSPAGVVVDAQGNVYIADSDNHRIRRVGLDGIITTIAGSGDTGFGKGGYSGDGGPATQARLNSPDGMVVDAQGNIYIADTYNHRIRRVGLDGVITTIAGTGAEGYSGDGGPATQARLNYPAGMAVDAQVNIYIADEANHRIRRMDSGRPALASDFDGDGDVDFDDFFAFASAFGKKQGETRYDAKFDLITNGVIDLRVFTRDYQELKQSIVLVDIKSDFGLSQEPPLREPYSLVKLTPIFQARRLSAGVFEGL